MSEDTEFTDAENIEEIAEASDLLFGFAWHDEGQHWDLSSFSFPDVFDEAQADQLSQMAQEFAERLTQAGLALPEEDEE
ncbi:MAG: hypothetical protein ACRDFX_06935 [Chloroflexota bacterium]